jgi:ArsR family transcriptional regulator
MNPLFDVLSDATRRHLLLLLAVERELCVCELVATLEEVQPKISRHLALLREAGWIKSRRDGIWIFYSLNDLPIWAQSVISALQQGAVPAEILAASRLRLIQFTRRPVRVEVESVSV